MAGRLMSVDMVMNVGFDVFTAVVMKSIIFWDMILFMVMNVRVT
jgi:hypothetical protein